MWAQQRSSRSVVWDVIRTCRVPNWAGDRAPARHPRRTGPERRRPRCNGAADHVIRFPRLRDKRGGRLRLARRRTTSLIDPPPPRRARRGPGLQVGQCQSRVSGRSETEMGWQPRHSDREVRAPAPSPTDSRSAERRRSRPLRAALRFMREGAGRVIRDNEEIRRSARGGVQGDAPLRTSWSDRPRDRPAYGGKVCATQRPGPRRGVTLPA
jgi:hypothetical protein